MSDYEKYRKFLNSRGVNLSKKDFDSLMSLIEAAADYATHIVAADQRATGFIVEQLNRALESAGMDFRFKVDAEGNQTWNSVLNLKSSETE